MRKSFELFLQILRRVRQVAFRSCVRVLSFGFISRIPQRNLVMGYLTYIAIGLICLSMPFAQRSGVSVVDNLFMITSAVSTTGLATVDIATSYTLFGQIVLLLFIQLGGLGYMTLSTYLMYNMTHHFVKIKRDTINTAFAVPSDLDLPTMIRSAVRFTLFFEVIGAVVLWWLFQRAGVEQPAWNAIFHSISSFCTAGFSLFPDSMMRFRADLGVNLVIAVLSYAGAMGFIFITDLWRKICHPKLHLSYTSKVILVITTAMTVIGSVLVYLNLDAEQFGSVGERVLISIFQTMSAMTTVGFNTIDLSVLHVLPLLVLVVLMFVGASPSGTGGGVKSTTISAIYAFVKSKLSDQRTVTIGHNQLPSFRVENALASYIFYQVILFFGVIILLCTDHFSLGDTLFEVTSALGTVGLSAGITASLSVWGKLLLVVLMYIGRLGVLVFGSFMLTRMAIRSQTPAPKDLAV